MTEVTDFRDKQTTGEVDGSLTAPGAGFVKCRQRVGRKKEWLADSEFLLQRLRYVRAVLAGQIKVSPDTRWTR